MVLVVGAFAAASGLQVSLTLSPAFRELTRSPALPSSRSVTSPLPVAPEASPVYNPAFDVTPARLIRAIICERGVISPVTREKIAAALEGG